MFVKFDDSHWQTVLDAQNAQRQAAPATLFRG
jgi:hypothetical protein